MKPLMFRSRILVNKKNLIPVKFIFSYPKRG